MIEKTLRIKILKAKLQEARHRQAIAEMEAVREELQLDHVTAELAMAEEQRRQALKELRDREHWNRQDRRPSKVLWPDVYFDDEKQQWACEHSGVTAYGDSPEQACDNFDHLWVFGYSNGADGTAD